ncbi:MAG: hypothetical protein RIK87_08315 [Fuerstiella sp.]
MSSENQWASVLQEFTAQGIPFLVDTSGDPEPWLSFDAISRMTGLKTGTIANKATGVRRHPFLPMIKISDLEAKIVNDEKTKTATKSKALGKRA